MSLVLQFTFDDYPLLLGDLLLSGDEISGRPVSLPTVGSVTEVFPEGSGFVPVGLTQKIAVLGDDLAIGWAGKRLPARTIIRELMEAHRVRPFTMASLNAHFDHCHHDLEREGVGLVGFLKDPNGIAAFGRQYWKVPTADFGAVGILGTGLEQAEQALRRLRKPDPQSTTLNALQRTILVGLPVAGTLLATEVATCQTLGAYFGAGYELLTLIDGRFQKLGGVTYVFWHGRRTPSGFGINPYQVYQYSYLDDLLVIRTATLKDMDLGRGVVDFQSRFHIVPPVYRDIPPEVQNSIAPKWVPFRFLSNILIVEEDGTPGYGVFFHVRYFASGEPPVWLHEEETGLRIEFSRPYLEELMRVANRTCGSDTMEFGVTGVQAPE